MTNAGAKALICLNRREQKLGRGGLPSGRATASRQTVRGRLREAHSGDVHCGDRIRLCCTKRGVNLRLHAPCGQRGQPGLGSSGLDLIGQFVPPFPNVRFRRRHDRKLNASVDHGSPLYHVDEKQLLFDLQSIRANTGPDQLSDAGGNPALWSWFQSVPNIEPQRASADSGTGHWRTLL